MAKKAKLKAKVKAKRDDSSKSKALMQMPAPDLPYQPRDPKRYRPNIGLIACGGITGDHLTAYRKGGYHVAALCDVDITRAQQRRREFYPKADVYSDWREVIDRDDIEVVDLAAHPAQRAPMIEAALMAGKHVLSQKPFVLDLGFGQRMVDLADRMGVMLAVNQNGRWAPHYSYIREAIRARLLGDLSAVHMSVHWNHGWIQGTEFDKIKHVILYDFAIHWFDLLTCFLDKRQVLRVYASVARTPAQKASPPLLAQALVEYEGAQASLAFDADTQFGPQDRTYVTGSRATITSVGPDIHRQKVTLVNVGGAASPRLTGRWFPDGFRGTMGELLCAIEEGRQPSNSARNNLKSLELCFAAVASAERHKPVVPGTVKRLPRGA